MGFIKGVLRGRTSRSRRSGILLALAIGFAVIMMWPTPASCASAFDLAAAIKACPAGGTVTVPAGTWNVPARINVYKSINIVGTPGQSILTANTGEPILSLYDTKGVTISGLTFVGPSPNSTTSGLWLSGPVNVTIKDLAFRNLWYGVKIGSGPQGSGCSLNGFTASGTTLPLFVANLSSSSFANVNIQMTDYGLSSGLRYHGIYLERSLHGLTFNDIRVTGGSGYCLQLYTESGASDGITFNRVYLDATGGRYPLVAWGYSDVTFNNTTMIMTRTDGPCAVFHGTAANITFDGITASGGRALGQPYSGQSPRNIVMRNGTYQGKTLGNGVTFQNVTLGGSTTPTTVQATTTTTVKPTTTTTVRPTTTTTVRPTTTTTVRPTTTTTVKPTTTTTVRPTTTTTVRPTTTTTVRPTTTTTVPVQTGPVTITSPKNASVVPQGLVDIQAVTGSNLRVSKVCLYVNGRLLSQDYLKPWAFSWNTRYLASGSKHELTVVARDLYGREIGRSSAKVTISGNRTVRAAELAEPLASTVFSDLNPQSPCIEAVSTLTEAGVISGFADGTFGIGNTTNRAQFAKMMAGAFGLADGNMTTTPFTDLGAPDGNLYPQKFVAALTSIDAITGVTPTQFAPWNSVTRAQVVTIVVRALQKLDAEMLTSTPTGLSVFGDFSEHHAQTMAVAEANGLLAGIPGYGEGWNPWAPATRGEVAQLLFNTLTLDRR